MQPLMTTSQFLRELPSIFQLAQQFLRRDGHAATVLFAYDRHARRSDLLCQAAPQEILDFIHGFLREHRAVAAIMVSEAWYLDAFALARTTDPLATAPSQHPDRREVLQVLGTWPALQVHQAHTAEIIRDGDSITLVDLSAMTPAGCEPEVVSWLSELLPQH